MVFAWHTKNINHECFALIGYRDGIGLTRHQDIPSLVRALDIVLAPKGRAALICSSADGGRRGNLGMWSPAMACWKCWMLVYHGIFHGIFHGTFNMFSLIMCSYFLDLPSLFCNSCCVLHVARKG